MRISTDVLIIGTGAAGLAAGLQLHRQGITRLLLATESLQGGTSINTGSDKQTFYKLSLCGSDPDSVREMAETYFAGGSTHGDLALVEAATSVRAFMNLVELGLPFPKDAFGQYVGYKTDHDPRQRATSIGPYTSREMCRAMIRETQRLQIPVREGVFVKELRVKNGVCHGAVFFQRDTSELLEVRAKNTLFAVGGPGGLYATSVYPKVHLGAIGVALAAGAAARNLPESQFGLASTRFRWNVSGTYMQCVPRFLSTAADGVSDPREFLTECPVNMLPLVFLKGYQWPFDARKTLDETGTWGSSMVDLRVYVETVLRGRRVFLDFRENPTSFSCQTLGTEAAEYLERSGALTLPTPIARLKKMNPAAIALYADHGIDITSEPLEVAVCAQHNNGGLAGDTDWQSTNLRGLFPIGEVNGSHGVYRPGGSALNAGQVGAIRAAEAIVRNRGNRDLPDDATEPEETFLPKRSDWRKDREILQQRSTRAAGFLRNHEEVCRALEENAEQLRRLSVTDYESHRNGHLLLAQRVYLDAIRFELESGVGSRGSAMVLEASDDGQGLDLNGKFYKIVPENTDFRNFVLESRYLPTGEIVHRWEPCQAIPEPDSWFENVWNGADNER
ncbi:MAG: FAD-binding protein [Planctomycetia bacterium]|nr:FAD-binding protein [Planctomycetia bacterium]